MAILGVAASVAIGLVGACSNQPEGARCDYSLGGGTPPGTDDCESPLVCTNPAELTWPSVGDAGTQRPGSGICCPPDRKTATTGVCKLSTSPILPDGSADTGIPDAGTETGTDAQPADSGPGDSGAQDADAADAADQ